MSIPHLPNELLIQIISYLSDPSDFHSLLLTSRLFYSLTRPIFATLFAPLLTSLATSTTLDFCHSDLPNWDLPNCKDPIPSTDPATLLSRKIHLQNCVLAYHALTNSWTRLFKTLLLHRGVPGEGTILLSPFQKPFNPYRKVRPQAQYSLIVSAALRGDLELVRFMIEECGTTPNCFGAPFEDAISQAGKGNDWRQNPQDPYHHITPLQAAISKNHINVVQYLLPTARLRGPDGKITDIKKDIKIYERTNPNLANVSLVTPVMYAFGKPEILQIVLEGGGRALCFQAESETPSLHQALSSGIETVKLLVEFGHPLGVFDYQDNEVTLLMDMIAQTRISSNDEVMVTEDLEEILRFFLEKAETMEKGVKIWDKGHYGYGPVFHAARLGLEDLVELFIEKGSRPNVDSWDEKYALKEAREKGFGKLADRVEAWAGEFGWMAVKE